MIKKRKHKIYEIKHLEIKYNTPLLFGKYRALNELSNEYSDQFFIPGNYYISEEKDCITDEKGNRNHKISGEFLRGNFAEIMTNHSFEELKKLNIKR